MFDNIGSKLKSIAQWYTVLGMIAIGILVLVLLFSNALLAILYGVIGMVSVWASGCLFYGVGHAVENTDVLRKKLAPETLEPEKPREPAYQPAVKRPLWKCASCGMENQGHIAYCNGCGTSRDWSEAKQKEE